MANLIQIENEPTFITRLGDDNGLFDAKISRIGEADADIEIGGGDPSKFESIIEASKWGKYFLNIRNPFMPLRSDVKSFDKGIITIEDATLGIQERYFTTKQKNPGLEYEMVFASQPPSEIRLDIEHSSEMTFAQTLVKDMIPGSTYALNVPGSWTVYVPESNNEKRTGKFCHFYMPKWIDLGRSAGDPRREEFVEDFRIEDGQIIIISGGWVETAVYPIILDPTIGWTTEGASKYNAQEHIAVSNKNVTVDGVGGQANTLYVWTENNSLGDVKVGLYDGEVGGSDLVLVGGSGKGYTIPMASQANNNWSSVDVSGESYNLGAGVDRNPVTCGDAGGHQLSYDTGQGANVGYQKIGGLTFADELQNPSHTGLGSQANAYSVYLEYAPAAVGGIRFSPLGGPLAGPLGGPL